MIEQLPDRETEPGILNAENILSSADIATRTRSAGRAHFRVILTPNGPRVI